jgi:hypothetical protein
MQLAFQWLKLINFGCDFADLKENEVKGRELAHLLCLHIDGG